MNCSTSQEHMRVRETKIELFLRCVRTIMKFFKLNLIMIVHDKKGHNCKAFISNVTFRNLPHKIVEFNLKILVR